MRKFWITFLPAAFLVLGGCAADNIELTNKVIDEDDEDEEEDVPDVLDPDAEAFTFSSTGDPESSDDISNSVFTRIITITYADGSASVDGDDLGYVQCDGAHVTVTNPGTECVVYALKGSTSDGSFNLYSERKQALLLDGVSITNPAGAAINNQSKKRTFVMVEGSNSLSDGASASYSTSDDDLRAVFFSEGQLVFSGSGTLHVTACNSQGKSGISSDDYVRIMDGPTLEAQTGQSVLDT